MANGKAQITDLNLTAIDANLSDYLSDIRPYEGFVQCNSPWIGGLLNNVYKKKVEGLPEGHKLVKVHNGDIYSLAIEEDGSNGFYKNGVLLQKINPIYIKSRPYVDPIATINNNKLIIHYTHNDFIKDYEILNDTGFTYDYWIEETETEKNIYLSIYPVGKINYLSGFNDKYIATYQINETGKTLLNGLAYPNKTARCIFNGGNNMDTIENVINSYFNENARIVSIHIDPAGLVVNGENWNTSEQRVDGNQILFFHPYILGNPNSYNSYRCVGNSVDEDAKYWKRGRKIPTSNKFSVLYYGDFPSGISCNNSIVTDSVDKIIKVIPQENNNEYSGSIVVSSNNKLKEYFFYKNEDGFSNFDIVNDYIIFDTVDYYNTYDLNNNNFICRSDDYNDRCIPVYAQGETAKMFATGYNVNALSRNIQNISTQYPQGLMKVSPNIGINAFYLPEASSILSSVRPDLKMLHEIEIYLAENETSNARYFYTLVKSEQWYTYIDDSIEDTLYPLDQTYNILYGLATENKIKHTYINESIIESDNGSYILAKSQNQKNIFGYYEYTFTEVENIFLTQGQFYGLNDKYIYSLGLDNSTVSINGVIGNKQDLLFLGAFPTMALFWSKLDKSLYAFTGDAILQKTKEAYRINSIYNVYCDPARLTMIIPTDIGVIIIYQNQVMVLDEMKEPIEHIYYDSNSYYLDDLAISLSEQEGYEPQDIKLHTEYYGVGAGVKSVNDCVYLRVAKGKNANGKVKFQSFVLNEKTTASEEKEIALNDSMFDSVSGSAYIKYQPKNQAGLGFSVKVETTNPIVSMSIGHNPESVANTSIKL